MTLREKPKAVVKLSRRCKTNSVIRLCASKLYVDLSLPVTKNHRKVHVSLLLNLAPSKGKPA